MKTIHLGWLLVIIGLFSFSLAENRNITVAESLKEFQETEEKASRNQDKDQDKQQDFLAQGASVEAQGDTDGYYQEPRIENNADSSNEYMMLWVKLIVIMGIFCSAGFIILRYLKKRGIQSGGDQHLFKSLAEFPLGINKKIQIVKVINDYYVLAAGQDEITLLNKVEDKESIDLLDLEGEKLQAPPSGIFEESLKNYLNVGGWSPISVTKNLKRRIK